MVKGWVLCKHKFYDSYETTRLVEEFKNHNTKDGICLIMRYF